MHSNSQLVLGQAKAHDFVNFHQKKKELVEFKHQLLFLTMHQNLLSRREYEQKLRKIEKVLVRFNEYHLMDTEEAERALKADEDYTELMADMARYGAFFKRDKEPRRIAGSSSYASPINHKQEKLRAKQAKELVNRMKRQKESQSVQR